MEKEEEMLILFWENKAILFYYRHIRKGQIEDCSGKCLYRTIIMSDLIVQSVNIKCCNVGKISRSICYLGGKSFKNISRAPRI